MRKIFFIPLAICFACGSSRGPDKTGINEFFNLDSLLDAQITWLSNQNLNVEKIVSIDGESEKKMFSFDEADWKEELKPVRDLDLNLPIYVGAILVTKGNNSLNYRPDPDQDVDVRFVSYHFDDDGNILRIEGKFLDDRASRVYSTERSIELSFRNNYLRKYRVFGFQKMVTRDTTYFDVSGTIVEGP